MDRSLDEIINERPARGGRRGGGPGGRGPRRDERPARRDDYPRDGVHKKYPRDEPRNIEGDWVHDRYEDNDRDYRRAPRDFRDDGYDRRYEPSPDTRSTPAAAGRLRVDDLHYDIREDEIKELFGRIGPVESVRLLYDRQDRSQGTAYVNYTYAEDARAALREFDGANAYGQPIRLQMMPPPAAPKPARNPFDYVEKPSRSLFDRIETSEDAPPRRNDGGRRRNRSASPDRRRLALPEIDRYVPGGRGRDSRSPIRRRGTPREGGRRPGARREDTGRRGGRGNKDAEGRPTAQGRPRKTADELDAEMDDYFNTSGNAGQDAAAPRAHDSGAREPQVATINQGENPMGGATGTMEDDIDLMVE